MSEGDSVQSYDVIIVGAGLVGASLAASLNTACPTLSLAVVDGGSPPKVVEQGFDPRVVALTLASKSLFESLGLWPSIESKTDTGSKHRACPYTHMHVWDGEGTGKIDFDAAEMHQANLGYIVENSHLLSQVHELLRQSPQTNIHWGDGLEAIEPAHGDSLNRQQVILKSGQTLSAPLVLAADGANSKVRQQCGFETREWHYGQQAIVTTVTTEHSHQFTAWQRFMQTGPLAFLPLLGASGEDRYSSIVWSLDDGRAEELMALSDADFAAQLASSFEYKLGTVEHVDKRYCFPLRQRHAKQYVKPGIALVGDAAHTIHPLAGQGVNLGLLDVVALVNEIERALLRNIPLNEASILRRYQRTRLGPNMGMMAAMEGFKQLYGAKGPWLNLLRNTGMSQLNRLSLFKNAVASKAMG